jgi:hypothetical protein
VSLLRSAAPHYKDTSPVKVAIIDDGVDASLKSLDGKIAAGQTFSPFRDSLGIRNGYYTSSCDHGTYMATLVSRTCPSVRIYVAKVGESAEDLDNDEYRITSQVSNVRRFHNSSPNRYFCPGRFY